MKFAFLLLLMLLWQPAPAEDDDESVAPADNKEYRSGTLRMGAYAVGNIKARAYFGPSIFRSEVQSTSVKILG